MSLFLPLVLPVGLCYSSHTWIHCGQKKWIDNLWQKHCLPFVLCIPYFFKTQGCLLSQLCITAFYYGYMTHEIKLFSLILTAFMLRDQGVKSLADTLQLSRVSQQKAAPLSKHNSIYCSWLTCWVTADVLWEHGKLGDPWPCPVCLWDKRAIHMPGTFAKKPQKQHSGQITVNPVETLVNSQLRSYLMEHNN